MTRSGKAFILVFAVDNTQSFHEAVSIWETVKKTRGKQELNLKVAGIAGVALEHEYRAA
jgi:hypothetical protein